MIDVARWNRAELRSRYRSARPFRHVVVDDLVAPAALAELRAAFEEEPAHQLQDDIFDVMASSGAPEQPALCAFHAALGSSEVRDAVGEITAEQLAGVELRAYVYLAGHYLLPHADRDDAGRRRVAYAFYVELHEGVEGGELDLYGCEVDGDRIVSTRVEATIAPRPNRCVLFEVSPTSIHRVREVVSGARMSLAGWFTR